MAKYTLHIDFDALGDDDAAAIGFDWFDRLLGVARRCHTSVLVTGWEV